MENIPDNPVNPVNQIKPDCAEENKDKYYCLNVGINTDDGHFSEIIANNLIQVKDNRKDGEFVYSKYMNPVAYIIMSGMIITGI